MSRAASFSSSSRAQNSTRHPPLGGTLVGRMTLKKKEKKKMILQLSYKCRDANDRYPILAYQNFHWVGIYCPPSILPPWLIFLALCALSLWCMAVQLGSYTRTICLYVKIFSPNLQSLFFIILIFSVSYSSQLQSDGDKSQPNKRIWV